MDLIKGPLSFVVGGVRVVVLKEDDCHSIQPCLYSGLNKDSKKAASKKDVNAAFSQLKVKKINLSAGKKKANVDSSFEESQAKADVIPSIKNDQNKSVIP